MGTGFWAAGCGGGLAVMVPVDTYLDGCDEIACSSGLFEIIAWARLISVGLTGAEAVCANGAMTGGRATGTGLAVDPTVLDRIVSEAFGGLD